MSSNSFPIYCTSLSGLSFYKIESAGVMTEIQLIGSKYAIHKLEAKILPEYTLIADLLSNHEGAYPPIGEEEYNAQLNLCIATKQRIG